MGIRSSVKILDIINDVLFLFWKYNGIWHERKDIITTDPGLYYLNKPIRDTRGTAIMKEQQVRGSHKIGKHQVKYLALKQQKPITVIRDFDRDNELY